jgi:hypothetical protein
MSLLNRFMGISKKKKKVDKEAMGMRKFFVSEIAKRDGKQAARAYAKERRKKSGW